jgi:hypothetical protein
VDIILTNPPFGGKEEDGIESNFPAHCRTKETADLFRALFIRLLKPGGRAAEDDHGDPTGLLVKLDEAEQQAAALREQLKGILAEALLR